MIYDRGISNMTLYQCIINPFGSLEPWIDPLFLYRYLICIHMLGCIFLILQHGFLRLRSNNTTPKIINIAIWACLIVPIAQIPISIIRIAFSFAPDVNMKKPLDAYLNFFWSPMCTTFLIWAAQVYIATKCKCQFKNRCYNSIYYNVPIVLIIISIGTGYMFSHVIYSYTYNLGIWNTGKFLILTTFGVGFISMIELIGTLIFKNIVNTVSYSLMFMVGTWIYFLRWVP